MPIMKQPRRKTSVAIADKLRQLRNALGLTQIQAAELAGVSARTWIAWENRQRNPGRLALRALQQAFPDHF